MKKRRMTILLMAAILVIAMLFVAACSSVNLNNATDGDTSGGTVSESEIAAATEEVESTLSATASADYLDSALLAVTAEQEVTEVSEDAVYIDLSDLTDLPDSVAYKKNVLSIKAAGVYVLTGELNGSVQVDKEIEGTVQIVLDNATIRTLDSQTSAAIVFKQSDSLRILTLAEGTVNEVSDSIGDTEADGDGAAIQAKKSSLTINGSGKLVVNAVGEEANGIKVKKTLTILSAEIEVTAVKNGVKADDLILIKDATLTVTAGNDGIKTDIEPEAVEATEETEGKTAEEVAAEYASDPDAGYIYIEHSTLTVTAADDGIAANSCLYINNRAEDVITVTTNGGAPTSVTERSSDAADGKALKVSGIVLEVTDEESGETTETLYPATYDRNYALVITGGTFRLDSNDDALHSKGNILITGGTFTIASGDDGIHAEYLTKIAGGNVTITKGYEGIEGGAVEITGGTISVTAVDDGVNAANADLKNYTYYILITGGDLTVNCSGDGLDSNGRLLISGGTVKVFGPTNGGNSALDSETGTTISGGTVIATCYESMDPVGSTQYRVTANVSVQAGTSVTLKDASGNEVVTFTAPKTFRNLTISTPDMTAGSYTLICGTSSQTLTATVGTTGGGQQGGMGDPGQQGGMGAPGGRQGGFRGGETAPAFSDDSTFGDMTPPDMGGGEYPSDGMAPPEIPSDDGSFGEMIPPQMPNGKEPPMMPSGEASPTFSDGEGQMGGGRPFGGRGGFDRPQNGTATAPDIAA